MLLFVGALRWGGDLQGGAPYAYQDPKDTHHLIGFEVDLAAALAHEIGEPEAIFVQTDWTTLTAGLSRGTYDIAMNGLEDTPARRAEWILTKPYYRFDLQWVTRASDVGTTIHGKVGTLEGTQAADFIQQHPAKLQVMRYQGVEEPYIDLLQGRLDSVLMDSVIGDVYGRKPGLVVAQKSLGIGHYVIACGKPQRDLCLRIEQALERMRSDGRLKTILAKYNLWNPAQEALQAELRTEHDGRAVSAAESPLSLPVHGQAATFGWPHLGAFLHAAWVTLWVSTAAMLLAALVGLVLAVARAFGAPPLSALSALVVESLRGTPVLLQLYVVYFGLAPYLALPPLVAAILTLGFNYGAYESEIYRAGLGSVSKRQWDAGATLGLSRQQTFLHVVLPQAVRVALPGMANDFVALLKDSALVSVITVVELTKQMSITAVDVRSWLVPGAVCAFLYLAMSYPASRLGLYLETRMRRGDER